MSEIVRKINRFFNNATKAEVDSVKENIVLSERQEKIFRMYYIKKLNVGYIADTLNVCELVIKIELRKIREKMLNSF